MCIFSKQRQLSRRFSTGNSLSQIIPQPCSRECHVGVMGRTRSPGVHCGRPLYYAGFLPSSIPPKMPQRKESLKRDPSVKRKLSIPGPRRSFQVPETYPPRFLRKCSHHLSRLLAPPSTCIFWVAGQRHFNYKNLTRISPRRLSYEIYHQRKVDPSQRVVNTCCSGKNAKQLCVNPRHLVLKDS